MPLLPGRPPYNPATPISHALLPLLLGLRWIPRSDHGPSLRVSALVAFSGVLPDVLSPHLSLDARHAALSHSLVGWAAFAVVIGALSALPRLRRHRVLLSLCIGAYGTHILCDLATGGVPLFSPILPGVYGDHYLPLWSWIVADGALLSYIYLVHRWIPLRRRLKPGNHGPGQEKSALRARPIATPGSISPR